MLDKTVGPALDTSRTTRPSMSASATKAFGPRDLIDTLLRRKHILFFFILFIPAGGLLALHQTTARYTATGTLIYEPGRYRTHELQSILEADPTTEATMASQVEILHGLRTIEPMAQRLDLFSKPEFNGSLRPPSLLDRLKRRFLTPAASADDPLAGPPTRSARNDVLLAAQRVTAVRPLGTSHVIEVSFTATDPVLAAAAVNSLMDIYIKAQLGAKFSAVDKARAWLERRAKELRAEVSAKEDKIAVYRSENGLVQGVHAEVGIENVSQLTEALAKARADLASAEGRLSAVQSNDSGEAALAPSVVKLREQSSDLAAQLQSMRTRLGPRHPDVVSTERELREVQAQEAAEKARVVSGIQADLRSARDRVQALEKDVATAQGRVDRSAHAEVPLSLMQRDADASRALLASVLQSLEEIGQQAAVETPDAHEVSLALPPESPSSPRATMIIAAAMAGGLLLGLFVVYLVETNDTTMAGSEDVRRALGLPCFALIPNMSRRALGRMRVGDVAALRPLGRFAEQMRNLRTGLWLGAARPRTVSITGARASEGKTTVALALGRVAALSGEKVILLDCDLRRPSIARLLGGEGEPGLAEVLAGETELQAVIKKDPLTPMTYITAGTTGPGAAGLFMSGRMAELISALRDEHDLVLMDAPPALAIADTRLIAHIADATLFCARWRRTPGRAALAAIKLLDEADASVVGVALTRVDTRIHGRSGYSDASVCGPQFSRYFRE